MKTTKTILLLLLPWFLLSALCSKNHPTDCEKLGLYNHSDKSLITVVSYDYPDTSMNFQDPLINPDRGSISPNSKGIASYYYGSCLESIFNDHKIEKISVFVFDAEILNTTPWQQVRQNYQVLKRYDYSLDEVKNCNYSLDFP